MRKWLVGYIAYYCMQKVRPLITCRKICLLFSMKKVYSSSYTVVVGCDRRRTPTGIDGWIVKLASFKPNHVFSVGIVKLFGLKAIKKKENV